MPIFQCLDLKVIIMIIMILIIIIIIAIIITTTCREPRNIHYLISSQYKPYRSKM